MAGSALLDSYSTERWASTLIGLKSSIYWKYTETARERERESQPATHQQQSAVAKTYNNNNSISINNHYNNKLIARTNLQLYSSYANGAHRARRSGKKTFRMVHSSLVVTWMSVIFISVMCLFDSSSSFCWLRVMLCENRATWSVCLCQFYKRPEKYFFFLSSSPSSSSLPPFLQIETDSMLKAMHNSNNVIIVGKKCENCLIKCFWSEKKRANEREGERKGKKKKTTTTTKTQNKNTSKLKRNLPNHRVCVVSINWLFLRLFQFPF